MKSMPSSDLKEYSFFAELEKSSASQKEYLEKLQEKKADENKIGGRFNFLV